jgi:hypothetical protein
VYDGSAVATVLSRLLTVLGFLPESLSEADRHARAPFIASWLGQETLQQLRILAGTIRAAIAVMLAGLCGVFLVVARRRFAVPPARWPSATRLGILTFFAVLAAFCAVDACLIGFQRNAIRERIRRDYPNSFPGKLIQRERPQRERVGVPFEPESDDAISGRHVSMKDLRGKVVGGDLVRSLHEGDSRHEATSSEM